MRISDWSSDVCSSDLAARAEYLHRHVDGAGIVRRLAGWRDAATATAHEVVIAVLFVQLRLALLRDLIHAAGARPAALLVARRGARKLPRLDRRNRSEERLVGKECFGTGRFRWSPYH